MLALVPLLLTSCAATVTYQKAVASLKGSKSCCASMSEFSYAPLPLKKPVTFRIDGKSKAFVFPSGKSYFKAFRLPHRKIPYRIHVKSFALGDTVDHAHIFYPQVALLDDHFAVVKQSKASDFKIEKAGLGETAAVSWELLTLKLDGSILVDAPDATYMVMYTTSKLLARKNRYMTLATQPVPIPVSGGMLWGIAPVGKRPVDVPNSPFGWISVEIEPGH